MLDLVRPGQVHRRVVRDARADRVPGTAIDDVVVVDREDVALVVKPHFDIVDLVAGVGGGEEMFAPLLDPPYGPAETACEERDQQILGIGVALAAEPAADIECDNADPCLGNTERRGHFAAHPMHDLRRRPHGNGVGARVVGGDDTAALHRHGRVAMVPEAALQSVRRARQHRLGIPLGDGERADQVCVVALVHDRRPGLQRGLGIHHCRQLFQIEPDQLGGVLGLIAGLGDDDRDRLADMPDLVVREQRLLRVEEFVLDDSRPFAWHAYLALRHRWDQLREIGPGQRQHDSGCLRRPRQVDPSDTGMRQRAAYEHRMQHAGQHEIGDKLPLSGQKPPVLPPPHRIADIGSNWLSHGFPRYRNPNNRGPGEVGIHVSADRSG